MFLTIYFILLVILSFFFFKIEFNYFMYFINLLKMKIFFLNFFFMFVVFFIFSMIFIFSFYYLMKNKNWIYFICLLSLFCLSMLFLLSSNSILMMFLGWDGLGVSSFILVNFFKNWITLNNSSLTFMSNRLGDAFFLILISIFLFKFDFLNNNNFIFLLIFLIITKSAQFPFMSWLPAAMAAPTPVSALVHSSTLVTAGIFLLFIFKKFMTIFLMKIMFLISILTLLGSGLSAFLETDFKKMVAFSTLSQMAFLMIMLTNFKFMLTILHLFSHAFFKSMLFMGVGSILHSALGSQESRNLNKTMFFSNFNSMMIFLSILNLMGLLFLSGFWSKDLFMMFFNGSFNKILFILLFYLLICLTFIYNFKMIFFLKNLTINVKIQEKSFMISMSLLPLMFLSLFFIIFMFENYLFFYENYLFSPFNFMYFIFIILSFLMFLFSKKMIMNMNFFKILGLLYFNNILMNIYKKLILMLEKNILDKNFYFIKMMKNNILYYFLFLSLMFLIFM